MTISIINQQMNQWKAQATELNAKLAGFDLKEVTEHANKVKAIFNNLTPENIDELKELLSSPLEAASMNQSDLWNTNLYMTLDWTTTKPEDGQAHIVFEVTSDDGSVTEIYSIK